MYLHIPSDAETDDDVSIVDDPEDVNVDCVWEDDKYGDKITVELPAPWEDDGEAKGHFKKLDWDLTHRGWRADEDAWEADFEHLNTVIVHMLDGGYDVTVDHDVAVEFEDGGFRFLPHLRGGADVAYDIDETMDEFADSIASDDDRVDDGHVPKMRVRCTNCVSGEHVDEVDTIYVGEVDITAYRCVACGETGRSRIDYGTGVEWSGAVRSVDIHSPKWKEARGERR